VKISRFKLIFSIITIAIVLVFQAIFPIAKLAAISGDEVSWSNPVFYKAEESGWPGENCVDPHQTLVVLSEVQTKDVCVTQGRDVSFGYYRDASYVRYVVGFNNDNKMYPLRVDGIMGDVFYSASQDTLIVRRHLYHVYGDASVLGIYKNFSKSLVRSDDIAAYKSYALTKSVPDYVYSTSDGSPWIISEMNVSNNREWIVVHAGAAGLAIINIETLESKRISSYKFIYGIGLNPVIGLAISNDGKTVAMVGINIESLIFSISPDCGDTPEDYRTLLVNPCEATNIRGISSIYNLSDGFYPKFNDSGSELTFFSYSRTDILHSFVLRADNYEYVVPRVDYMALGDSYSSGEGELNDNNYLVGTNVEYEKCHVSTKSYAFRLSYTLGLAPNFVKNVACSGAVVGDIVGDDDAYLGQGDRLGKNKLNLSYSDRILSQKLAIDSFLPGRVKQLSFANKYQPKIVTVGIGGNDIGFAAKLTACLGLGTCSWADNNESKEKAAVEIKGLFDKLVSTYQDIHTASPNSKIYAIGYPKLVDPNGSCGALTGFLLNEKERIFLDEGVKYLNQIISAAARKAGVKYIDIESSLGDHTLCGDSPDTAINFIKLGDDIGPVENSKWFRFVGQESFHPNALGHQLESDVILDAVENNIMTYDYCYGYDGELCPIDTEVPEPSSYWIPDAYHNYPEQKIANYVTDSASGLDGRQKQLSLGINSLEPNSFVTIEIASTPQMLGQFVASADGSFDASVELPIDLEEGYHTVHLYGTSYTGDPIELYQVIKYVKPFVEEVESPTIESAVDEVGKSLNDINRGGSGVSEIDYSDNNAIAVSFLDDSIKDFGMLNRLSSEYVDSAEIKDILVDISHYDILFIVFIIVIFVVAGAFIYKSII